MERTFWCCSQLGGVLGSFLGGFWPISLRLQGDGHDVSFLRLQDRHRVNMSPDRWLLPGWYSTRSSVQRVRPSYKGISIFNPYN